MQISQIVLIVTISVIGILALISLLIGLKSGWLGMLTYIVMNVVSAVGAFFLTKLLIGKANTYLGLLLNKITNAIIVELFTASPSLKAYIISTGTGLITPIAFLIVYLACELLCLIIALIYNCIVVRRIKRAKMNRTDKGIHICSRLAGSVMGIVTALMFSACFFMPVAGYINYGGNIYNSFKETEVTTISENVDKSVNDIIALKSNIIYKYEFLLTNKAFRSLTVINTADGTKSNAIDEVNVIINIIPDAMGISKMSFSDVENIDMTSIDNIVADVSNSESLKAVFAEVFKQGGTKWKNYETFLGVNIKQQLPLDYVSSLDGILERMSKTTKTTVIDDMQAFSDTAKAIKATAVYMSHLKSSSTENTDSSLDSDMEEVLKNINEGSADLISSAITGDIIEQSGIDAASADVVADIIKSAITEISSLDETEKVDEAKAFNDILAYTTGDSTADPDELIETVLSSQAIINAVKDIMDGVVGTEEIVKLTDEQKMALATAFVDYEAQPHTPEEQENIDALKKLFNIV